VATPGDGLVSPSKDRPGEVDAAAVRGLSARQQQVADFRHRERDQVGNAPFSSALARSRVISR
jgi:hypothetical protein